MTRSPGEKTAIKNKQATALLPHREYTIDCNFFFKPTQALYNDGVPALHVYSQISRAKQTSCAYQKMDSIILNTILVVDTALSEIKLPKYQK